MRGKRPPLHDGSRDAKILDPSAGAGSENGFVDAHIVELARVPNVRQVVRNGDQRLNFRNVEFDDATVIGVGVGGEGCPSTIGGALRKVMRRDLVGLDVAGLGAEIDHHVAQDQPLAYRQLRRERPGKFHAEIWRRVLAVNLDGTFYVTRAFLPELTAASGRVINIASIAGREGTPLLAAYCAAKHGVVGLTRALAEELRTAKVSVNAICPGSVDTAMLREGLPGASADMSPDDIARTALFLAHAAPSALTGACIDVYG